MGPSRYQGRAESWQEHPIFSGAIMQKHVAASSSHAVVRTPHRQLPQCAEYNFDSPDAIDVHALLACVDTLRCGNPYDLPVYDFTTHSRSPTQVRCALDSKAVQSLGLLLLAHHKLHLAFRTLPSTTQPPTLGPPLGCAVPGSPKYDRLLDYLLSRRRVKCT